MTNADADNPLADGPYWDALREFAVAEMAVQRGHARCFRRLAELLLATPDGAFALGHAAGFAAAGVERVDLVRHAEQCQEIADGTEAEVARAAAALARDDRGEVAAMAGACMLGYMRGLEGRTPQIKGGV